MAERIVSDVPARAARGGPGEACRVPQTQIDTVAWEFTANDTSLRFGGGSASEPSPARNRTRAFVFARARHADGPASPPGDARTCPKGDPFAGRRRTVFP